MALLELANLTLLAPEGEGPIGRILAQMPDPMRPDLPALGFMIVLLVVLYFYLRVVFFQPITKVMADRDRDLQAGGVLRGVFDRQAPPCPQAEGD